MHSVMGIYLFLIPSNPVVLLPSQKGKVGNMNKQLTRGNRPRYRRKWQNYNALVFVSLIRKIHIRITDMWSC